MKAIAQTAIKRKTGARGLRGVIESAMLDIMFEIPSMAGVKECIIDADCITEGAEPRMVMGEKTEAGTGKGSAESA